MLLLGRINPVLQSDCNNLAAGCGLKSNQHLHVPCLLVLHLYMQGCSTMLSVVCCVQQALAELSEAGLSEEKVEVLWDLYTEARQAQEDRSGVGAAPQGGQPAGPTQGTQGSGRVGMFALGVLSRLLTVLRLMYSVGTHALQCALVQVCTVIRGAASWERGVSGDALHMCPESTLVIPHSGHWMTNLAREE